MCISIACDGFRGRAPPRIEVRPARAACRAECGRSVSGDAVDKADGQDIRASLNGDGEAYARLVRRHQDGIAAYLWRFSRQREVCEELVQNVFVEAYLSLRSFSGRAPFAHWLRKIATRVGYRHWQERDRQRARPSLSPAEWDQLSQAEDTPTDPAQAGALLHAMLGQLPPRDRLVLTLMYLEGHSVAETAALTGWTQTMVKVQAYRARNKLKRLLESRGMAP